jgi:prepilin-type processing-associated H-X9-DG protein
VALPDWLVSSPGKLWQRGVMRRRSRRTGLQRYAAIGGPILDALHGEADGFQLADARGREFHVAFADGHELSAEIVVDCSEAHELALLQLDAAAQ